MPVVNVNISSLLQKISGINLNEIINKIPYIGLDIEGFDNEKEIIRLEFNPNRPDFASENGIIRALKGIFEIELGIPHISITSSDYSINVDNSLSEVRPFIYGLVAKKHTSLTESELLQIISIQEDLNNGLGRKRKKSSIGIHNFDTIEFPLCYTSKSRDFAFEPLEENEEYSLDSILKNNNKGKEFGNILDGFSKFPILLDQKGLVLSFPPIINGNYSKIDLNTKNLFVEITSKNSKSGLDILNILSYDLYEMGFEIFTVNIHSPFDSINKTPNLKPFTIKVHPEYINKTLGLDLDNKKIIHCLRKSRCSGKISNNEIECTIPPYRTDIIAQIDICEEIAIGYGIYNVTPLPISLYTSGEKTLNSFIFEGIREVLIGLGFLEVINTSIISKNTMQNFSYSSDIISYNYINLSNSKNSEFDVMRNSILPSIMLNLSTNIHEKYPQKLFEIGKIFEINDSKIIEFWSLGIVVAHNNSEYSEIKAYVESLIKYCFDRIICTPRSDTDFFIEGHSSKLVLDEENMGIIGEFHPKILENFNLRTLVSAAEINLSKLISQLDLNNRNFN